MVGEEVGQTFIDGRLRWYRSGVGANRIPFEEDGVGLPPEDIRRRLIDEGGEWVVIVSEPVDKPAVVGVVRAAMQLNMAAAAKLLKSLPGVIYTGTKIEADWLRVQLLEVGAIVEIRRSESKKRSIAQDKNFDPPLD